MQPLISICVPTYNGAEYLQETLDSVRKQTILNRCEILIVDDGSTDSSLQIAKNFRSDYPENVRVFQNENNLGLVGNWNKCLAYAKGEWIQFIFQDDMLVPNACLQLYETALHHNTNLVLCDRTYIFHDVIQSRQNWMNRKLPRITRMFPDELVTPDQTLDILTQQFGKNFLGEPVCGFFHRTLISKYGNFDARIRQICDFEFWLRIAVNEPFFSLNRPLVKFRVHANSQSSRNRRLDKLQGYHADRIILWEYFLEDPRYEEVRINSNSDQIFGKVRDGLYRLLRNYGHHRVKSFVPSETKLEQMMKELMVRNPQLMLFALFRRIQHALTIFL